MKKILCLMSLLVLCTPAFGQAWRPPMVLWTRPAAPVGFYFGPHFFAVDQNLTRFLDDFGRDEVTLSDAFGLKHLYFPSRGVELVATRDGRLVSVSFYLQDVAAVDGRRFAPADMVTDTGLGPGNTWNDVWHAQGKPHRQKEDEQQDHLFVLEYHLSKNYDLDFYFREKDAKTPILKIGIYPRG